jgi:hypothetical protein
MPFLNRLQIDALPGKGRAVLTRPTDLRTVANFEQQFELFGIQFVIVLQLKSKKRKCFDGRASTRDNFGAPL